MKMICVNDDGTSTDMILLKHLCNTVSTYRSVIDIQYQFGPNNLRFMGTECQMISKGEHRL